MMGARRAIASRKGAVVVGGARAATAQRDPSSDRGQPWATRQARDDCNKIKKKNVKTIIRITWG